MELAAMETNIGRATSICYIRRVTQCVLNMTWIIVCNGTNPARYFGSCCSAASVSAPIQRRFWVEAIISCQKPGIWLVRSGSPAGYTCCLWLGRYFVSVLLVTSQALHATSLAQRRLNLLQWHLTREYRLRVCISGVSATILPGTEFNSTFATSDPNARSLSSCNMRFEEQPEILCWGGTLLALNEIM